MKIIIVIGFVLFALPAHGAILTPLPNPYNDGTFEKYAPVEHIAKPRQAKLRPEPQISATSTDAQVEQLKALIEQLQSLLIQLRKLHGEVS